MVFLKKRDVPFLGFAAATLGLRVVPRSLRLRSCLRLGKWFGDVWYHLDRTDAALTRNNMTCLLGDRLSAREIDRAARTLFQNVAFNKLVNDLVPMLTQQELHRFLRLEGAEHLEMALAQGRGVVLLGAHYGLSGYPVLTLLKHSQYPVSAVLGTELQPDDSWVYRSIVHPIRRRSRRQFHIIDQNGTPQPAVADCLRRNRVLLLTGDALDDETLWLPPPHVLPVPFLGHTLTLKTGPFRLARWLGAPVLTCFVVPRSAGFTVTIEPPLPLRSTRSSDGLLADLTAFAARFESHLMQRPAYWMHWRHETLPAFLRPASAPEHENAPAAALVL